jgi:hypothetical protein
LNSIRDRYDFPDNYEEVCSQTQSQVRTKLKHNPELDLVSVYSDIRNVEMDFEENQRSAKEKLMKNLKRIEELDAILNEKEN